MKKFRHVLGAALIAVSAVLAACSNADQTDTTTPTLAPTQTRGALQSAPQPSVTAESLPGSEATPTAETAVDEPYPAQPTQPTLPPTPTRSADYPAVPTATSEPTPDPYPAGLVWINRPVGIQCQEGFLPGYGSLGEAVSTMRAAGVSIVAFEEVTLAVPDECGGPTAEHFRLQISAEDAAAAASMGWTLEEE